MTAMATLHVRNVPADVYDALRARAEREGRSLNGEVIAILRRTLLRGHRGDDLVVELRALREQAALPANAERPEELIREDRNARSRRS